MNCGRGPSISFSGVLEQYQRIKTDIDSAIKRVVRSGWYILGREVESFEHEFANYCGSKYAVGCACGTEAIALSLMCFGIKSGDEVILPSNTAVPTASAVSMLGATPVFVDADDYFLIDAKKIERAVTKRTKAIIPVHLYGQMVDMDGIITLAKKRNLKVIEDACQAHGAEYKRHKAGAMGDAGCFSFYPTKNLGCFGDGGAITTSNKEIYKRLVMLRNDGQNKKYYHLIKGINSRLDALQAAILKVRLKYLDKWNEQRRKTAGLYNKLLEDICVVPAEKNQCRHIFHLYVIRTKNRENLQKYLKKNGIDTLIHYPVPMHLQKAYKDLGYKTGCFPKTERFAKEILSLPMHSCLSGDSVKYICQKIREFAKKRG